MMSGTEIIVKQFKKLVSISLKNESINLHIIRSRLNECEVLEADIRYEDYISNEEYLFFENSIRIIDVDMVVKNDLLYEVLISWQPLQRDIIYLSLCENWSDSRIGARYNMARSTVQRVKKKLQFELKEKIKGSFDRYK